MKDLHHRPQCPVRKISIKEKGCCFLLLLEEWGELELFAGWLSGRNKWTKSSQFMGRFQSSLSPHLDTFPVMLSLFSHLHFGNGVQHIKYHWTLLLKYTIISYASVYRYYYSESWVKVSVIALIPPKIHSEFVPLRDPNSWKSWFQFHHLFPQAKNHPPIPFTLNGISPSGCNNFRLTLGVLSNNRGWVESSPTWKKFPPLFLLGFCWGHIWWQIFQKKNHTNQLQQMASYDLYSW